MQQQTSINKLDPVLQYITESTQFIRFRNRVEGQSNITVEGLSLSCSSLILTCLLNSVKKKIVVVSKSAEWADQLYSQLYQFIDQHIYLLLRNGLDSSKIPGFVSDKKRFFEESVAFLKSSKYGLVVTDETSCKDPFQGGLPGLSLEINLNTETQFDVSNITSTLKSWGYNCVDSVIDPLSYARRGGIIDIFPLHSALPIRIDTFGESIDSIRRFNPISQRSTETINSFTLYPPSNISIKSQSLKSFINKYGARILFFSTDKNGLYKITSTRTKRAGETINYNCKKGIDLKNSLELKKQQAVYRSFIFNPYRSALEKINKTKKNNPHIIYSYLEEAFSSLPLKIICIKQGKTLGRTLNKWRVPVLNYKKFNTNSFLADLSWDIPIVHRQYGIGLFRGLLTVTNKKSVQECIKIKYSCGGSVIVPVSSFHLLHPYTFVSEDSPKINELNSPLWKRDIKRAKSGANDFASELVRLYTLRKTKKNHSYSEDLDLLNALSRSFPYIETGDQLIALSEVYNDMNNSVPMNRLLIGDVGFGKTEVALRSAMKAICSGYQVILLAPTTLLTDQHYMVFSARLESFGVRISLLSRFLSRKLQLKEIESFKTGNTDLLIGTHSVLNSNIVTDRLSLLIIDEEHRFGVKHKEHILSLYPHLDLLSLSATPIPRTLQRTLSGSLDFSTLSIAPLQRVPTKTFIQYFDFDLAARAIFREIRRGGSVFLVQNNIDKLNQVYKALVARFQNLKIRCVHGKLNTKDLEKSFLDFYNGKINVLCGTSIIESGLDIPAANTMIICDSHKLGLSQLHQLRGRIGRSNKQAYCYLTVPKNTRLSEPAKRRLKIIEQNYTLGSGFTISHKDLEMRGSGNIFGYKQSGNISKVGYHLYSKLLKESLNGSTENAKISSPTITVRAPLLISEDYMSLSGDRINFYSRLSNVKTEGDIKDIKDEMRDRFGEIPLSAKRILSVSEIKMLLKDVALDSVVVNRDSVIFFKSPAIDKNMGRKIMDFYNPLNFITINPGVYSKQNKSLTFQTKKSVDGSLSLLLKLAQTLNAP